MRLLQISAPEAHRTAASTQPDAQPALRTGLVAPSGVSCGWQVTSDSREIGGSQPGPLAPGPLRWARPSALPAAEERLVRSVARPNFRLPDINHRAERRDETDATCRNGSGFCKTATRATEGASSFSSDSHFPHIAYS